LKKLFHLNKDSRQKEMEAIFRLAKSLHVELDSYTYELMLGINITNMNRVEQLYSEMESVELIPTQQSYETIIEV
jgi:hypothetical protein